MILALTLLEKFIGLMRSLQINGDCAGGGCGHPAGAAACAAALTGAYDHPAVSACESGDSCGSGVFVEGLTFYT